MKTKLVVREAAKVLIPLFGLIYVANCGSTADTVNKGRCKKIAASNQVAAANDPNGAPWKFSMGGGQAASYSCFTTGAYMRLTLDGYIQDGSNQRKGGLVASADCTAGLENLDSQSTYVANFNKQNPGQTLEQTDDATDACGVFVIHAVAICPPPGQQTSGSCQAISGPLASDLVNITITNVIPTVAPAIVIGGATSATGTTATTGTTTGTTTGAGTAGTTTTH